MLLLDFVDSCQGFFCTTEGGGAGHFCAKEVQGPKEDRQQTFVRLTLKSKRDLHVSFFRNM